MKLRLWPHDWVSPRIAWSCLMLQLRTYREEYTVYMPDDATPEELAEMAAEQRVTAAERRALTVIHNNGNTGNAEPARTLLLRELRNRMGVDA